MIYANVIFYFPAKERNILKKKTHFLNAIHLIQIHRAVLEKLPFEKKVKKILTTNIS